MDLLPVLMNLHGQLCLEAVCSPITFQKIQLLLKTGARKHLQSQENLRNEVEVLLQQNLIHIIQTNLKDLDLRNYHLINATSEKVETNQPIAAFVKGKITPVNIVDQPELYSFLIPSIVDRSPLIIAVSSSGKSPTLSQFIRNKYSDYLPESCVSLAIMIGEFSNKMNPFILTYEVKREFWLRIIFSNSVLGLFLSGEKESAGKYRKKSWNRTKHHTVLSAKVNS